MDTTLHQPEDVFLTALLENDIIIMDEVSRFRCLIVRIPRQTLSCLGFQVPKSSSNRGYDCKLSKFLYEIISTVKSGISAGENMFRRCTVKDYSPLNSRDKISVATNKMELEDLISAFALLTELSSYPSRLDLDFCKTEALDTAHFDIPIFGRLSCHLLVTRHQLPSVRVSYSKLFQQPATDGCLTAIYFEAPFDLYCNEETFKEADSNHVRLIKVERSGNGSEA